jgi:hypothetical protein
MGTAVSNPSLVSLSHRVRFTGRLGEAGEPCTAVSSNLASVPCHVAICPVKLGKHWLHCDRTQFTEPHWVFQDNERRRSGSESSCKMCRVLDLLRSTNSGRSERRKRPKKPMETDGILYFQISQRFLRSLVRKDLQKLVECLCFWGSPVNIIGTDTWNIVSMMFWDPQNTFPKGATVSEPVWLFFKHREGHPERMSNKMFLADDLETTYL